MPLGIGILVFIIDQLVKHLVVSTMHLGQSLPVIKGIFHITYVLNPGAAFGMLEHQRWFFILVALAAVLLGAAFYKKLQQESFLMRSGA
ncbi:MAG: signal peptidase II, partial [Anaerovibrio sp.]